jgi:hypothetical protein
MTQKTFSGVLLFFTFFLIGNLIVLLLARIFHLLP